MANEKTKRRIFHLPAFFIGHNAKKENARKVFLSYTVVPESSIMIPP